MANFPTIRRETAAQPLSPISRPGLPAPKLLTRTPISGQHADERLRRRVTKALFLKEGRIWVLTARQSLLLGTPDHFQTAKRVKSTACGKPIWSQRKGALRMICVRFCPRILCSLFCSNLFRWCRSSPHCEPSFQSAARKNLTDHSPASRSRICQLLRQEQMSRPRQRV